MNGHRVEHSEVRSALNRQSAKSATRTIGYVYNQEHVQPQHVQSELVNVVQSSRPWGIDACSSPASGSQPSSKCDQTSGACIYILLL